MIRNHYCQKENKCMVCPHILVALCDTYGHPYIFQLIYLKYIPSLTEKDNRQWPAIYYLDVVYLLTEETFNSVRVVYEAWRRFQLTSNKYLTGSLASSYLAKVTEGTLSAVTTLHVFLLKSCQWKCGHIILFTA